MNECQTVQKEITGEETAPLCCSYSVLRGSGSISIEWFLTKSVGGDAFSVQRSPASRRSYREIRDIPAGQGDLRFKYIDLSCEPGRPYRYRIVYRSACGFSCILFETKGYVATAIPTALQPNCPNPFDVGTELRFSLGERARTSLAVYDVEGKLVRVLVNSDLEPGFYLSAWNGRDDSGRLVMSGVYFCYLRAGEAVISRKMILLR